MKIIWYRLRSSDSSIIENKSIKRLANGIEKE